MKILRRNIHNRKIGNYLLDKKLQLHYVLFVTALSVVICGTLGTLIWQQENVATELIREQAAELKAEGSADIAASIANLESDDQNLVLSMAAVCLALILVLSFLLIKLTHRVAGPLHKMTLYFDKIRDGQLDTVWPLRKGDMLQNFYEKFHKMHTIVHDRHLECNRKLKQFVVLAEPNIDVKGEHGHRLDEIRKHCSTMDESLF